jgi:hypothetical protein
LETNVGEVNAQVGKLGPQITETPTAVNAADNRVTRLLASRFKRELVSQEHLLFATGKYELLPAHKAVLEAC